MKSNNIPVLHFRSNQRQTLQHYTESGDCQASPIYEWDEATTGRMPIGDDELVFTQEDENCIKIVQRRWSGYEPYYEKLHRGETVSFYGNSEESDHDGMTREVYQVWIEVSWLQGSDC